MIITIKFIEAENDPNQKMKIENSQHISTATIRIGENIENNWLSIIRKSFGQNGQLKSAVTSNRRNI